MLIRKIITFYNAAKLLSQTNRSDVALKSHTEQDQRDLALGRWTQFKHTFVPAFTVGLNADNESLLLQYCLRQAYNARTGGVLASYRPNSLDSLEATKLAIDIVKDCQFEGMLLSDKLKMLLEAK